jgi:hypothetical protein
MLYSIQFTCFPSTKVQILTPEELQRAARAVTPQNFTFQTPKWTRGNESLTLLEPLVGERTKDLALLGLGGSVGTGSAGVVAEVGFKAAYTSSLRPHTLVA